MKKTKSSDYSKPRAMFSIPMRDPFKMLDVSEVETIITIDESYIKPAYQDFCTECSERVTICECQY
jgi:hypothetical protein